MNRDELLAYFRDEASEIAERDMSFVTLDTRIAELAMDSLSTIELVGSFEREFDIYIPSELLGEVQTVADLFEVVEARWAPQQKAS